MKLIYKLFYNILFIPLLWFGFHVAAFFDSKVKSGIDGRKNLFAHLERSLAYSQSKGKRIWIHSSSLGEFEQAKPIIAELKKNNALLCIIASFFSPSGFENAKFDRNVDVKTYLPFDSQANAKQFLEITKPDLALFMSYDLWSNHIWELRKRNVPIAVANVRLRMNSLLKRMFYRMMLNETQFLFTTSENEIENIRTLGIANAKIENIGETRFDQVWKRAEEAKTKQLLVNDVVSGTNVFFIGSSWDEDERVLIPAIVKFASEDKSFITILTPHEPTEKTLARIESQLNGKISSIRFSQIQNYNNEQIILIDSIGVLLSMYQYASVAFVGGSFKEKVHNVLEPAVFGIPVIVGPKFQNSNEAIALIERGGIICVNNEEELFLQLKKIFSDVKYKNDIGAICKSFVEQHRGATEKIVKRIKEILKLQ
jgi:3-deoxy-D-manno-octulosonic-acid transferase